MKAVGILGGMGPEATILLMQKVLWAVPAKDDTDHIPLIVHQNPQVPSRIKRLIEGRGEDPAPVLARMAQDLERAGAKALAMPCNTAHAYAAAVQTATDLPFLDMRTATVRALPKGRIGILASPAVRLTQVFDEALKTAELEPVWPADEAPVLDLIRRVKAGENPQILMDDFQHIAAALRPRCDHLLIACTELSLLTGVLPAGIFTDSLDCLAREIVAFACGHSSSST